jgi:hypothetical protein
MVNSTGSILSKAGTLLSQVDLNVFFGVPAGFSFSDPRVIYDPLARRWFASGLAFNASNSSQAFLAVSPGTDPSGNWQVYQTATSADVFDQPKIGVTNDKLVMSWNEYSGPTSFIGQQTLVLQKSDLLAGLAPRVWSFSLDNKRFNLVPVPTSTSSTAYLVYNSDVNELPGGQSAPYAGVVAITGTPAAANVVWTESDPPIRPTPTAPGAQQPPSGAQSLPPAAYISPRFESVGSANGVLSIMGYDGCFPNGDTVQRSCLRLIKLSTPGTSTVLLDLDYGSAGTDLFYPAVATDSAGNLNAVFSVSSPSIYPSVYAGFQPAGTTSSLSLVRVQAGAGVYNSAGCNGKDRWGDYSAAALDPTDPTHVWVAGEYAASATDPCDWGTAIAQLTLAPPTVTNVAPVFGPPAGGTTVTLTGTDFAPNATTVMFGQTPSPAVTVQSSTQLTAVTPPEPAGSVAVTAVTANGTSAISTNARFFFGAPPAVNSLVPATGPAIGGTSVTISGSGFLGATAVNFGTVAAVSFSVASDTQVTAVSPPEPAGIVDVTVATVVASPASPADQFTFTPVFPGQYTPLPPFRILDTRNGTGGFAKLGPAQSIDVQVAGVPLSGVPAMTTATPPSAVVLNVTATNPTAAGFLTLYPTGVLRPLASNLNFAAGRTVPNLVEVALGLGGKVTVYNGTGSTDVIFDVAGWVSTQGTVTGTAGLFRPLVPMRLMDTRSGFGGSRTLGSAQTISLQVTNNGGVPASGVSGVVLNVTATNSSAGGFLTVFPTAAAQPLASNLNFLPGQTVPNRVLVKLGAGGKVSFFNGQGTTDVVVDVGGWFTDGTDPTAAGGQFTGLTPARILDTRNGTGGLSTVGSSSTVVVQVAGQGNVPAMTAAVPPKAVVLNVTVTNTSAAGYLTLYPSDASARPLASDLNWTGGLTVPNLGVVKLGADGKVAIFNGVGSTDVIADVVGWYN